MRNIKFLAILIIGIVCKGLSQNNPFFVSNKALSVPVVFHVMHYQSNFYVTDSMIDLQLDILNSHFNAHENLKDVEDYAADVPQIKFVMAKRSQGNNSFNGIHRPIVLKDTFDNAMEVINPNVGGVEPWNKNDYLNIWLCPIDSANKGWVLIPELNNGYDGIILNDLYLPSEARSPLGYDQGKTLTYLMGQYLGLKRTDYGQGCVGPNLPECFSVGDMICDTPPMEDLIGPVQTDSINILNTCIEQQEKPDMFQNYMSRAYDSLKTFFTRHQVDRMRSSLLSHKLNLLYSNKASELVDFDIRPKDFSLNESYGCSSKANIAINIENKCKTIINQLQLFYLIDNGIYDSIFLWDINIDTFASVSFDIELQSLTPGFNTIKLWTAKPNAEPDGYALDDTIYFNYYFNNQIDYRTLPLEIDFEAEFEQSKIVYSMHDKYNWYKNNYQINYDNEISSSMTISHFYNAKEGEIDRLYLPNVKISGQHPKLIFDYAYAKHSSNNYEELTVNASSDCGENNIQLYNAKGGNLETISFSVSDEFWYPKSSLDWKRVIIDLKEYDSALLGINFQLENGYGNNFYLDNIQVIDSNIIENSIHSYNILKPFIYPNPAEHFIYFEKPQMAVYFEIFDMQGSLILQETLENKLGTIQLPINHLESGMYLIKIHGHQEVYIQKVYKL